MQNNRGLAEAAALPLTIEHLTIEELPDWFDFMSNEIFPGDPREIIEGMWYDDGEQDIKGIIVAKTDEGRIVGSVKAGCMNMQICGQPIATGIISGVGIQRDFRGCGLSKRLFDALYAYIRTKDVKVTHLYSEPDTLEYYLDMGYRYTTKREEESFYRMYMVISPFLLGETLISNSGELVELLQAGTERKTDQ